MQTPPLIPALRRIFAPPYQDYMGLVVDDARPSIPAAALFGEGEIDVWLAVCAAHRQAPDPRGIASLWAQRYLLALLPAALVANLVLGRELPLAPESCAVVIDADSGLPQAIRLADEGRPGPGADVFACTRTLIKAHLEPFAAALAARVRMSPRVITSSAAFLAYQVVQMLAAQGVASGPRYRPLFAARRWSDGSANPFFQPARLEAQGRQGLFKRVCCLSYTLGEAARCGSCPREA